jgi:hypothetical protein
MKTAMLFFVLLIATVPLHGEGIQYSDPELHYSIKFPEGWRRLPSEILDQLVEEFRLQIGNPLPKYDAWFQRSDRPVGDFPYLLISRQICRMPTLDELAAGLDSNALTSAETIDNKLNRFVKGTKLAKSVIDRRRNLVIVESEQFVGLGNRGKAKGKTCIFPGKAGVAQLNFATSADDVERSRAEFDFILESFSFEPSYDYQSGLVADVPKPMLNFEQVLVFALIGGFVGPLIYGFLKRVSPDYPPGLQRLRVLFVFLIVMGGLDLIVNPPNGPFRLTFDLVGMSIGFMGLVIMWSNRIKGSSLPAKETQSDAPSSL